MSKHVRNLYKKNALLVEIVFAAKCKKPMLAVRLQENYEIDGWLNLILATAATYNLCHPDSYEDQVTSILDQMEMIASDAKEGTVPLICAA